MKKTIIIATVVILTGLMLTGCCQKCRRNKQIAMRPIQGTVWHLTQFNGEEVDAPDKYEITFGADGRASGIGECNRFFGAYEVISDAGSIKMGPIGSTMMACPGMELEMQFFQILEKVHLYQFEGDNLYLFVDNKVAAVLAPTDKAVEK